MEKLKSAQYKKNYEGSKANRGMSVSYHQLVRDLKDELMAQYQQREALVHLLTFFFIMLFLAFQLSLGRVLEAQLSAERLFLQASFPRATLDSAITFSQVDSTTDVGQYILNVLFQNILNPALYAEANYTTVFNKNTLLWGMRFRTIEVNDGEDCQWRGPPVSVTGMTTRPQCFPAFRTAVENTQSGDGSSPCFVWQSADETQEDPFRATFATYPGSGFVEDFLVQTPTQELNIEAAEMLEKLKTLFTFGTNETSMLNLNTAALIVSCTLFNANLNTITYVRLLFEFAATGLVIPTAEIQTAPFILSENSFDQGTFVMAYFVVIAIIVRLGFAVLNLINEARLGRPHSSATVRCIGGLLELTMVAILILILFDIFYRVILQVGSGNLLTAIESPNIYPGAGQTVSWFWTMQYVYAFFLIILTLYFFRYLRLFFGLRFLWGVGFVSLPDLASFFLIAFSWLVGFGIFLALSYGPYSLSYATVRKSIEMALLQAAGYFSMTNVEYAVPARVTTVTALYMVTFIISFNFLLLNVYLAIILKAFGIVYHEVGDKSQLKQPELCNIDGGIRPLSECQAWCSRNKTLCGTCCSAQGSCWMLTKSLCCCQNHYHATWLSSRSVLLRLYEWKRRIKFQSKNFLTFQELRAALEGDKKSYRDVSNFQVDYLFSICKLKLKTTDADRIQAQVAVLDRQSSSFAEYIRKARKWHRANVSQGTDMFEEDDEKEQGEALYDLNETFDTFMNLKNKQIAARIKLEQQLNLVMNNQTLILKVLQDMQTSVGDMNSIPGGTRGGM